MKHVETYLDVLYELIMCNIGTLAMCAHVAKMVFSHTYGLLRKPPLK